MFQLTTMLFLFLLMLFFPKNIVGQGGEFNFSGILYAAGLTDMDDGLSRLSSSRTETTGQVFYNSSFRFKGSPNGIFYSFSTTFVFAIRGKNRVNKGHGLAFVLSPTRDFSNADADEYLGIFNTRTNGAPKSHIVAVELDTAQSPEFQDIDDNHVGVDINSLKSDKSASAGYFKDDGTFRKLSLTSGDSMQLWVEYDSKQKRLNVTLHPVRVLKPMVPLLSLQRDLSPYFLEYMYVGFTSSTGLTADHFILGWTFKINGTAQDIDHSRLPKPFLDHKWYQPPKGLIFELLKLSAVCIPIMASICLWDIFKRKKLYEVHEEWEVQYGPYKFDYKDLHTATKGFKDSELLGKGGFGKVYKGTFGYISPELARTGNASTSSDVFALGVVMLEIACGRKPILSRASHSEVVLTDWVLECWENGDIMQVLDQKIGQDYPEEQVELVLKLGLLCSHPVAAFRPNMSSVIQYLDNVVQLPHDLLDIVNAREVHGGELALSPESCSGASLTFTESFLSHGR
ncbi:unnamed protein product [Eruca vesicaria subsp. sativa]|uniref:Non-specific serine/threonine protein kinase n=1 Tax=Eruca vesicaria subsp. sativa TaxID=29727 RepID=A0ABC8M960_ERUVS|nr:unnamed protein product [Eruca vesicaria subsp. sativa]